MMYLISDGTGAKLSTELKIGSPNAVDVAPDWMFVWLESLVGSNRLSLDLRVH